jgi:aquaporin Z
MDRSVRSYVAEFLGTFILVFVGTAVATLQRFIPGHEGTGWLEISFAFGFTLLVLVLVIGPVSGCHINPAVTIAMGLAGKLDWKKAPGYIIAQLAGALAASGVLLVLLKGLPLYDFAQHGLGANENPHEMSLGALFGWELVMTALFLLVIFSATRSDVPGGFAALAIGGFLFVAHLIGAQLGDSSLNPARSFGPALFVGGAALKVLWVFVVAPILGGIVGWVLYRLIYSD